MPSKTDGYLVGKRIATLDASSRPMVEVVWGDAWTEDDGWKDASEIEFGLLMVSTVGTLIHLDTETVGVALSRIESESKETVNGVICIPLSWIVKVRVLG